MKDGDKVTVTGRKIEFVVAGQAFGVGTMLRPAIEESEIIAPVSRFQIGDLVTIGVRSQVFSVIGFTLSGLAVVDNGTFVAAIPEAELNLCEREPDVNPTLKKWNDLEEAIAEKNKPVVEPPIENPIENPIVEP